MKCLLSGIAVAAVLCGGGSAWAQQPRPDLYSYRLNAPTPEDAYRQGLITRWELERLVGPTPQAMQGPSPDSSKGFDPGSR